MPYLPFTVLPPEELFYQRVHRSKNQPHSTLGWPRRTHAKESATQKAYAFVGTRAEDSGRSREDLWQISRTAYKVLRPRGRRRKSDHLFEMGSPGAGPRWLAEARHEIDIWKPQLRSPRCDTRVTPEEKRRFLARRAEKTKQRRALFNAEIDAETT